MTEPVEILTCFLGQGPKSQGSGDFVAEKQGSHAVLDAAATVRTLFFNYGCGSWVQGCRSWVRGSKLGTWVCRVGIKVLRGIGVGGRMHG